MTNKANSKLSFLRRNLKGCPEKLKQTAHFYLVRSFMEYGATVWTHTKNTTVTKLRGCSVELQGSSRVGIRDTIVFLICLMSGVDASFSKETGGSTYPVLQNYYGLAQVPFEGVLVEAYKGTRRKHNMKFRQIGHTTSQYGQPFFPLKLLVHGTGLLSLKLRHRLYLDQILLEISVHPFRIIP